MGVAAAAAVGGGLLLSGAGSYFGSQASNRGGRQARDWSQNQYQAGQNRLGGAYFGSQTGRALRNMYDTSDPAQQASASDEFNARVGGPLHQQMLDLAGSVSSRQTGNLGYYDQDTARLGGVGGKFRSALGSAYGDAGRELGGAYGQATNLAAGAEDMAGQWGQGENARIERDTELARKGTGRRTAAALSASGFGNSTAAPVIQAGNDKRYAQQAADQKLAVSEGTIDRRLSARGGRVSAALASAGGMNSFRQAGLSAQERVGSQGVADEYTRSGGRMALEEGNLGRDVALRTRAQDNLGQILQSSTFNPWLTQGTSQFYPGASGLGQFGQNAGAAITGLGGQMYGQASQQALMQQYYQQMRPPTAYPGQGGLGDNPYGMAGPP